MARFLFCPVPEAGDVYPTVPVALELRSRGHQVAYLTNSDFKADLSNEGLPYYSTPGAIYGTDEPHSDATGVAPQLETLARVFHEFPADVLVDGAFPLGPRLFSESQGIPRASIHAGCFPIPTSDPLFPYGPGQPPPTDDRGRTLARLAALARQEQQRQETAAWDATRASLGLPPSGLHPTNSPASPYLVLLASSPALEYPRSDLPPQFWFTGPLVWQSRRWPMPERVARLAPREPIVYVSQGGTYNRNPVILKRAFQALAGEPVQVVATTFRALEPAAFHPLPGNVILERFIPFSEFVDRVSLVITHGGAGAVQAALSRGVPVITLPFTADQFEVAARCVWTGAGIRLDPWETTVEQLRSAVRTILSEPAYRANARRIMNTCAQLGGASLAADLLERLAVTREPVCRPLSARNPWKGEASA